MKKRLIQLDVLRAVAIFLVLGRHLPETPETLGRFSSLIIHRFQAFGWMGVDLFFVLSGFLVSGLIFREYMQYGRFELGRFFIRRGLKIYPGFYVLFIVTLIATPYLANGMHPSRLQIFSEMLYLQNYFGGLWGHTWSLAVEEHFYFLLAFLCTILIKEKRSDSFKPLIKIFLFLAIGILGYRMINSYYLPKYDVYTHLFPTHLRIDSLFFGVLLSYYHHFHFDTFKEKIIKYKHFIFWVSIIFILPMVVFDIQHSFFLQTFGLSMLYLGFGGLMIWSLYCLDEGKLLKNKLVDLLAKIGYYSYSIYLWHYALYLWVPILLRKSISLTLPYYWDVIIFVFGSLLVGIVMAKLIEMPVLKLRDRHVQSKSGELVS